MDARTAQLRHEIAHTRAMDATLTQLEQRVSQMPAVLLEQHVLGPVRGMQETAARATALLSRYPWLIIAAGALVGYQLHRAKTRPARPVPHPPPRAAVTPPREPPSALGVSRDAGHLRGRGGGRRARAARRWCSWTGTCPGRWMACRLRPACGRSGACRSSI